MTLFTLKGIVKSHTKRGRDLGFPTANIEVDISVPDGTYLGFTYVDQRKLPSIIFVGAPETFGETERRAESYILDFNEDLYNQSITFEIVKKLRDNKKFDDKKSLIKQMKEDEKNARDFFQII